MKSELENFDYFIDDLLSSDAELLKNELDFLLMQTLFNSFDLEGLQDPNIHDQFKIAI